MAALTPALIRAALLATSGWGTIAGEGVGDDDG